MGLPNRELKKDCNDESLTPQERDECLKYKTQDELLADPDLYSQILVYAVPYEEPFIEIIDALFQDGIYSIEIDGIDGGSKVYIDYLPLFMGTAKYYDVNTGYGCFVNGNGVLLHPDDDDKNAGAIETKARYIIPTEYAMKHLTMKEKYNLVENGLCWMIHNKVVTKKKWYQTGLFMILTFVFAIVLTVYGQPMMLIGLVGSTIVSGVFGDKAGIVLGILMAAWTLGTSLISTAYTITMNTLSLIARLANQIARLFFSYKMDDITDEAKSIADEQRATEDAINDIKQEALYIPFGDQLESMYITMYEMLYNQAYDQMASYSRLTTVDTNRNYTKGIA